MEMSENLGECLRHNKVSVMTFQSRTLDQNTYRGTEENQHKDVSWDHQKRKERRALSGLVGRSVLPAHVLACIAGT